jgi:hypothetical protein
MFADVIAVIYNDRASAITVPLPVLLRNTLTVYIWKENENLNEKN